MKNYKISVPPLFTLAEGNGNVGNHALICKNERYRDKTAG